MFNFLCLFSISGDDHTEHLGVFFSELHLGIGEGNGNPCQYSCLENPWTEEPGRLQFMESLRVRWVTSLLLLHFHALEKEMANHSSVLAWRIPGTREPGGLPSMMLHSQTWLKWLSSSSSHLGITLIFNVLMDTIATVWRFFVLSCFLSCALKSLVLPRNLRPHFILTLAPSTTALAQHSPPAWPGWKHHYYWYYWYVCS